MNHTGLNCDCDRVIEMEDMGIGVEEIIQYARAVLPRESIRALIRGLEKALDPPTTGSLSTGSLSTEPLTTAPLTTEE